MKIQILSNDLSSAIAGYKQFQIVDETVDLSSLSNNECELILSNEALDSVSLENVAPFIQHVLSKLRLGGGIVVGGTDIRLFSKAVANCLISEADASNIIKTKKSMTTSENTIDVLTKLGLKVKNCIMSGIHYEVTATRG